MWNFGEEYREITKDGCLEIGQFVLAWLGGLFTKCEGIRHPILPDLHRSSYIKNGQACCNVNACMYMLLKQINFNCPCCYYVGCNMMFML